RAELSRILRYLKRGGSELEASDHLLKLYQIHTALLHQSRHRRRLLRMLDLYRKARNPGRYRAVRALLEQTSGATKNPVPAYQTWSNLLEIFRSYDPIQSKFKQLLSILSSELNSTSAVVQYLTPEGVYERVAIPENGKGELDELRLRILREL